MIVSGNEVMIRAIVVNHLADAQQLTVGLTAVESYPFIDMTTAEHDVGRLARAILLRSRSSLRWIPMCPPIAGYASICVFATGV